VQAESPEPPPPRERRRASHPAPGTGGERAAGRPADSAVRVVRLAGREFRVVLEGGGPARRVRVEGPDGACTMEVTGSRDGGLLLDGEPLEARVLRAPDGSLAVAAGGETWGVEVLTEGEASLGPAGRRRGAAARLPVRAPMPGRVVAVEVEEGQGVEAGAGLFVIEAMKMENEVRAPRPGVVRGIRVSAGASVEGDQELCAIETGAS
jgi:biotin carboxyl carrier protein